MTLRSFARQHLQYGRGAAIFHRERAARGGSRIGLEPWRFYVGMGGVAFRRTAGFDAWRTAALLALTQVAGLAGFCLERVRARRAARARRRRCSPT